MNTLEIDGTLTRQLLPWPLPGTKATRAEIRKSYRYVTWVVEPVEYRLAEAHLGTGRPEVCVVMVFRGPAGGWTDARFVNRDTKLPKPVVKRIVDTMKNGTITGYRNVQRTFYYGWIHSPGLPHPRDVMMPRPQWLATLELHART